MAFRPGATGMFLWAVDDGVTRRNGTFGRLMTTAWGAGGRGGSGAPAQPPGGGGAPRPDGGGGRRVRRHPSPVGVRGRTRGGPRAASRAAGPAPGAWR